jgi:PAS domain S-box-containing protein
VPDREASRYEQLALAASAEAVIVTDAGRAVRFWNRGAASLFGVEAKEALGHPLQDLIYAEPAGREFTGGLDSFPADGTGIDTVCRRPDGTRLYVEIATRLLGDGETGALLVNARDITRAKVMRDARAIEGRFGALLDSTPDGMLLVDRTGRILLLNRQAEALFGYSRDEVRGQPVEVLLPERFRGGHVGHRSGFMAQPRTRAMGAGLELFGLRRDGEEFPVEISLSPLETDEGPVVISAIRDSTERRRFETALREKNDELARANKAKDSFLAGMSHELRTPLNAVIAFTGMLLMKLPGPLTVKQEHQLRTIENNARHLLALINGILDLAKVEAGKIDLHLEEVTLQDLLGAVVDTLRPQAEAKGLALQTAFPAEPVRTSTDVRAFSQIALNLAANAVKFTDSGQVTLALRRDGPPPVIVLSVVDTGPGIDPKEHEQLFGMFERGVAQQRRRKEGAGLGLHLSGKLATLLGGEIILDSEPGRGSTFSLVLPEAAA